MQKWIYNDGGRSKYFKAENVGDCVTRAIAIGTGKDYKEVYDALNELAKKERTGTRKRGISNSRSGVYRVTFQKYLESLGWVWHPTMKIGQGCKVHVNADELPKGVVILSLTKHLTCMIDGVINDTYDCSRGGTRCVYGYYTKGTDKKTDKNTESLYEPPTQSQGQVFTLEEVRVLERGLDREWDRVEAMLEVCKKNKTNAVEWDKRLEEVKALAEKLDRLKRELRVQSHR